MALRRSTGRSSVLSTIGWLFLLNLSLCAAIFGGTPAAIFSNLLGSKDANKDHERSQQQQQQQQRQQQNQYPPQQRRLPPPPPPSSKGQSQSQLPPPPPPGSTASWNRPPPPPMRQENVQQQRQQQQQQQQQQIEHSSTSPTGSGNVTKPPADRPLPPTPIQQNQQQQQQGLQQQQQSQQQQQKPPTFYAQPYPPPPPQGWRPSEEPWQFAPQPEMFQDWQQQTEYREDDGTGAHWDNMNMNMNQGIMSNSNIDNRIMQQEQQLDESMQREQALLLTVQNMTASVSSMEQREELHVRQLDVLTERVMDVEAAAAQDKNAVKEYQVNCTALGQQVAILEGQVEEWKSTCAEFADQHDGDEKRIAELRLSFKQASVQAEDLAGMIERHRLEQGLELYSKKKHKKSRGLFGWLFGWGGDDDDGWDEMHEAAKSTLLRALQTERNNVEELEYAVTSLQQNNSAIAEQVESRDLIIDELNDRVAVFEEDKVVLKAALRQLQKEMNDEAPRTQKLVDDLASAQKEVERLRQEIESLIATHQDEIGSLQHAISTKSSTIQQKESNLTVIGTYVDKLEERLADFAVARRDIEVRERKCQELETAVIDAEREREAMRTRVESFEQEHDELRELLEEIVRERTKLRKEIGQLEGQRGKLEQEGKRMRESVGARDNEIQKLQENDAQWQVQTKQLNAELEQMQTYTEQLQAALRDAESSTTELRNDMEATLQARRVLQDVLDQTEAAKNELQIKLSSLEKAKAAALAVHEEKAKAALVANEEKAKAALVANEEKAKAAALFANEEKAKAAALFANEEKAKAAALFANEEKVKAAALVASEEKAKVAALVANEPPKRPVAVTKNATDPGLESLTASEEEPSSQQAGGTKQIAEDRPMHRTVPPPPPPPPPPLTAMKNAARTPNSTQGLTSTEGLLLNAMGRVPVNESMCVPFNTTVKPAPKHIIPGQNETVPSLLNATEKSTLKPRAAAFKEAAATKKASDKGKGKDPLRKVRKFFSKTTGMHGFFSRPVVSRKRPTIVAKSGAGSTSTNSRPKAPGPVTKTSTDSRPKAPGPVTKTSTDSTRPKAPAPVSARQRPDVLSHTPGGLKTATPSSPFQKSVMPPMPTKPFQKDKKP